MHDLVVLGVVVKNLVLLAALIVDDLLSVLQVVFLFLRDLLRFLISLTLMQGSETGL